MIYLYIIIQYTISKIKKFRFHHFNSLNYNKNNYLENIVSSYFISISHYFHRKYGILSDFLDFSFLYKIEISNFHCTV